MICTPHRILFGLCGPSNLSLNAYRGLFPEGKAPWRETDNSHPSNSMLRISGTIIPRPIRLHGVYRYFIFSFCLVGECAKGVGGEA